MGELSGGPTLEGLAQKLEALEREKHRTPAQSSLPRRFGHTLGRGAQAEMLGRVWRSGARFR